MFYKLSMGGERERERAREGGREREILWLYKTILEYLT